LVSFLPLDSLVFGFLYSTEHESDIQVLTPIFGRIHLLRMNQAATNRSGPKIDWSCTNSPWTYYKVV